MSAGAGLQLSAENEISVAAAYVEEMKVGDELTKRLQISDSGGVEFKSAEFKYVFDFEVGDDDTGTSTGVIDVFSTGTDTTVGARTKSNGTVDTRNGISVRMHANSDSASRPDQYVRIGSAGAYGSSSFPGQIDWTDVHLIYVWKQGADPGGLHFNLYFYDMNQPTPSDFLRAGQRNATEY